MINDAVLFLNRTGFLIHCQNGLKKMYIRVNKSWLLLLLLFLIYFNCVFFINVTEQKFHKIAFHEGIPAYWGWIKNGTLAS